MTLNRHTSALLDRGMSNLWRVSRRSACGLVVMEGYHDYDPMSVTNVPNYPARGVRLQDQR